MAAIYSPLLPTAPRLLVVDDEAEIVAFVRDLLISRGYDVLGLSDSREVPVQLEKFCPDACIFDFRMPHRTGADLLDLVRQKNPRIEVIFLTAQDEASLAVDLMKRGASDYLLKPVELNHLLLSIGRALEHARSMGIKGSALVQIEHGALLHDIGKLKIPDSILWKPSKLDETEWETMRLHPEYGYQFLSSVEFLKGAAEIVYSHHEKYDGTGYPRRLKATRYLSGRGYS